MFRSFGLKENPFHVSPDPRFLFSGPAYETAMAELMFGIQAHRGLLVLTGEAGTGKTTLMRYFLQWLNVCHFSSAYIFHAHLDPGDLYEFILRDFGIPLESTRKSDLLVSLHRWLLLRQAEGDSPVIVIDEAQALSLRTLNELHSMLNLENSRGNLLQIVLAGQPELDEKLRRPESRALRQRIMVRCRLPLLTLDETGEYIESRLRGAGSSQANASGTFPLETVETIYSYARGIPRVVNLLCEHGLVGAYADHQTTVSPQNIRRAASEFDLAGAPFSPSQPPLVLLETSPLQKVAPAAPVEIAATTPETAALAAFADAPAPPQPLEVVATPAAFLEEPPAPPAPVASKAVEVVVLPLPAELAMEPEIVEVAVAPETEILEQATVQVVETLPHHQHEWRKHHSASAFQLYWREVASSFIRDWRHFFRSVVPQAATIPRFTLPRTDSARHKVKIMEPLRAWLAKPINPRAARSAPPASPEEASSAEDGHSAHHD
jgi:general secretion pathway protein A